MSFCTINLCKCLIYYFFFMQKGEDYSAIFQEAGLPVKRKLTMFKVTPDAILSPGWVLFIYTTFLYYPLFHAVYMLVVYHTACPRKSGPGKLLTNLVLYNKMLWTKFPCFTCLIVTLLTYHLQKTGMILIC